MLLSQADPFCMLETRTVAKSWSYSPQVPQQNSSDIVRLMITFQSSVHFFCKGLQGFPLHFMPFLFALVARTHKLVLFLSPHVATAGQLRCQLSFKLTSICFEVFLWY